MFDIREYYNFGGGDFQSMNHDILEIDDDVVSDIEHLLVRKVGSLYLSDRYKTREHVIEIIYPSLGYGGARNLMLSPDKIRFFLSFYPYKNDLKKIDKVVLRPRYVEVEKVELSALYLKQNRILVIYLSHPFSIEMSDNDDSKFVSVSLENLMDNKIIEDSIDRSGGRINKIPSLWNIISVIDPEGEGEMDKFLVKHNEMNREIYITLNEISAFYYRHGY